MSKLTISFPQSLTSSKIAAKNVVTKASDIVAVQAMFDTAILPTSYADVDCFAVFVGGPEEVMKRNTCKKSSDGTQSFQFGTFAATFAKNQVITLEVLSGVDRYIRIFGLKKNAASSLCPWVGPGTTGVDSLLNGFSPPVFLGEVGNLNFIAGVDSDVQIPVSSTLDTSKYIDDCKGPDMGTVATLPGVGGGGGSSTTPYLRLEGLYKYRHSVNGANQNFAPITIGKCLPVSLKTYTYSAALGASSYTLTNPLSINIPQTTDIELYLNDSTCLSPGAKIQSASIPAGSSQASGSYYLKVINYSLNQFEFNFILSTTEVSYSSDGLFNVAKPLVKFNLPALLVNNFCYPLKLQMFEADGTTPLIYSGSLQLSGSNFYTTRPSSTNCSGTTSTATFSTLSESNILYYQTPVSGVISEVLTITGPTLFTSQNTINPLIVTNAPAGVGVVPTGLAFNIPSSIEVGTCTKISLGLMNGISNMAPAPSAFIVEIGLIGSSGSFYLNSNCSGTPTNLIGFAMHDYSRDFYFLPQTQAAITRIETLSLPLGIPKFQSSPFTVSAPSSNTFIFPNQLPPFFKNQYIGSHEFSGPGQSLSIPLSFSTGAILTCLRTSNSTDCSALLSGGTFNWPYSEALSNTTYKISATTPSGTADYFFSPQNIFGPLNFKNCNVVLSGVISQSQINSGGGSILCLSPSSTLSVMTSNLDIQGLQIIGPLTGTPAQITVDNIYSIRAYLPATQTILANVNVLSSFVTTRPEVILISTTAGSVEINNINLTMAIPTSGNPYGINISNSSSVVQINNSTFQSLSGTSLGGLIRVFNSNFVSIEKVKISNSNAQNFRGLEVNGTAVQDSIVTNLKQFDFTGLGEGIYLYNASGGSFLSRINNATDLTIDSTSNSTPGVKLDPYSSLTVTNSYIKKSVGVQFVIGLNGTSTLNLIDSTIHQDTDYYGINLTASASIQQLLNVHFVRSSIGTSNYPLYTSSGSSVNSTNSKSNLFCSLTGTTWDPTLRAFGPFTGSFVGNNSQSTVFSGSLYSYGNRCTTQNP